MKISIGEIDDLSNFALSKGLSLNLIKLIPLRTPKDVYEREYISLNDIEKTIVNRSMRKYVKDFQNRSTYVLDSGIEVTIIRGHCNPHLCARCTRLRLTSSGRFKVCLYRENLHIDVKNTIKGREELLVEKLKIYLDFSFTIGGDLCYFHGLQISGLLVLITLWMML